MRHQPARSSPIRQEKIRRDIFSILVEVLALLREIDEAVVCGADAEDVDGGVGGGVEADGCAVLVRESVSAAEDWGGRSRIGCAVDVVEVEVGGGGRGGGYSSCGEEG